MSIVLVFGVAIVVLIVGFIKLKIDDMFVRVMLSLALACSYIGVAAPIAGMICGNNTLC